MNLTKTYFLRDLVMQTAGRVSTGLTALLCLGYLDSVAATNSAYDYTVVAQTGSGFVGFEQAASINHSGQVTFVGQTTASTTGFESVYRVETNGVVTNLSPGFSGSTRDFASFVQLNNLGIAVARERVSGSPPVTLVRKWANGFSLVAQSGTSPNHYDSVTLPSINNNGQVLFVALEQGSTFTSLKLNSGGSDVNIATYPGVFSPRPMLDDLGESVFRDPQNRIVVWDNTGTTVSVIASLAVSNFSMVGMSPGISDDGTAVAFAGDRGFGAGIFVSILESPGTRKLIKVAGENNAPGGPPPDLGTNGSGQPIYFNSFDTNSRIAVIHDTRGQAGLAEDNVMVCFIGTPSAAGSNTLSTSAAPLVFSAQPGLWTIRLDVGQTNSGFTYTPTGVMPVVQNGDTISTPTGPKVVNAFAIYDPLASSGFPNLPLMHIQGLGDHRVAFWASSGSDQFIVRADCIHSPQHVVLVMMENRSFDHFLGWLPGADGRQAGLIYTNLSGQAFPTWPLAPHFQGCGCDDPDHSYDGGRIEFNNGLCDGWLRANPNDKYSIGYYVQSDLSFLGQVAPNWTICDRYFAAIMAETQPNRIYQHAAQTDALTNRGASDFIPFIGNPVTLPTIWDRLAASNVTAHYYHAGVARALDYWGITAYRSISHSLDDFLNDCSSGTLPSVSFVDPVFASAQLVGDTEGNDDHPHADIRNGEAFLARVYNAVVSSSNWSSTVLIINFDEWGGFFDHVPPPQLGIAQIPPAEAALGNDGHLGFRVPCLLIFPWSRKGYVAHGTFDHTSVLKLIENRWGLAPLSVRDENANDLADVLDFNHPDFTHPPQIVVNPPGPFGGPCSHLQISRRADGSVSISWDAACRRLAIQSALTPLGPWSDEVIDVNPPYTFFPTILQRCYRFREFHQ